MGNSNLWTVWSKEAKLLSTRQRRCSSCTGGTNRSKSLAQRLAPNQWPKSKGRYVGVILVMLFMVLFIVCQARLRLYGRLYFSPVGDIQTRWCHAYLAGIAAFILSIGMAVDANVLF